jgi:hypothetical protein
LVGVGFFKETGGFGVGVGFSVEEGLGVKKLEIDCCFLL